MELFCARQRRKFSRGIKRASGSSSSWVCCHLRPITVLKKLRKAKRDTAYGEKPEAVKTHLRNMVIVPLDLLNDGSSWSMNRSLSRKSSALLAWSAKKHVV